MKHASVKRTRRPAADSIWASRREEILDAAAELFAKHGYADTDTQLLADKLGVGKGTLYRYFASKEELFLAAADRGMRQLRERIDKRIAGLDEPFARISEAVQAYLEFFHENPGFVELLIQERAHFKDRKTPTYFVHREDSLERWRVMYRGMIEAGRLRDIPVDRITDVFSQLMYGTIFINYFTGQKRSPETQARDILDIIFHGIKSEAERRR
jgi:AcrR family transcriptional regulator